MINTTNISVDRILGLFYKTVATHSKALDEVGRLTDKFRATKWYEIDYDVISSRLRNGWTEMDILGRIQGAKQIGAKVNFVSEVIPARPPTDDNESINILLESEKYRHPLLRKVSIPVIKDGKLVSSSKVERVDSFTLGDLVNYYINILHPDLQREEVRRALKNLLARGLHLDDILTGIDLWKEDSEDYQTRDIYTLDRVYCRRAKAARLELNTGEE